MTKKVKCDIKEGTKGNMENGLLQARNKMLPDIQQMDVFIEDMFIKAWKQF